MIQSSLFVLGSNSPEISTNDTKEAELSPPKFTKLLTDILVREGDTAVLECAVAGVPWPDVKWFLNSSEITFSDRAKVRTCRVIFFLSDARVDATSTGRCRFIS